MFSMLLSDKDLNQPFEILLTVVSCDDSRFELKSNWSREPVSSSVSRSFLACFLIFRVEYRSKYLQFFTAHLLGFAFPERLRFLAWPIGIFPHSQQSYQSSYQIPLT